MMDVILTATMRSIPLPWAEKQVWLVTDVHEVVPHNDNPRRDEADEAFGPKFSPAIVTWLLPDMTALSLM